MNFFFFIFEDEPLVPLDVPPKDDVSKNACDNPKKEILMDKKVNCEIIEKQKDSFKNKDHKESHNKKHSSVSERSDKSHSSSNKERNDFVDKKHSSGNKDRKESNEKKHHSNKKERNESYEKKYHSSIIKDLKDNHVKKHHSDKKDRNDSYEKKEKKYHSYDKKESSDKKHHSSDKKDRNDSFDKKFHLSDNKDRKELSKSNADLCKPGPSGYKPAKNVTDKKVQFDVNVKRLDKKIKRNKKLRLRNIIGFVDVDNQLYCILQFNDDIVRRLPHKMVREHFPQGLIDYYEQHMTWTN